MVDKGSIVICIFCRLDIQTFFLHLPVYTEQLMLKWEKGDTQKKEAGHHINVTLSRTENQGDVEYTLQLLLESSHSTRLLEK